MARKKLKTDPISLRINELHLAHAKMKLKTESTQLAVDKALEYCYHLKDEYEDLSSPFPTAIKMYRKYCENMIELVLKTTNKIKLSPTGETYMDIKDNPFFKSIYENGVHIIVDGELHIIPYKQMKISKLSTILESLDTEDIEKAIEMTGLLGE